MWNLLIRINCNCILNVQKMAWLSSKRRPPGNRAVSARVYDPEEFKCWCLLNRTQIHHNVCEYARTFSRRKLNFLFMSNKHALTAAMDYSYGVANMYGWWLPSPTRWGVCFLIALKQYSREFFLSYVLATHVRSRCHLGDHSVICCSPSILS